MFFCFLRTSTGGNSLRRNCRVTAPLDLHLNDFTAEQSPHHVPAAAMGACSAEGREAQKQQPSVILR